MKFILRIAFGLAIVGLIYFTRAHVAFLFYPVVMNALFLGVFSVSLFRTPLAEVFARRMGETLDARGVAYCRRVTVAWVVFLACNLAASAVTVFLSREIWFLYNGCVSYLLMGLMFAGEFLVRKRVRRG